MPPRAWQRMLSGRRLDLLDPTPMDIEIEDIAHGLAFVARWNGQTEGDFPYSVAEHSLLVEEIFGRLVAAPKPRDQLLALLHDAPEYVIGDMISPFKAALGIDFNGDGDTSDTVDKDARGFDRTHDIRDVGNEGMTFADIGKE